MMADNRGTESLTGAQSPTEASTQDTETTEDSRFAPGTFTPQPRRASTTKLVSAQARMETLLFLRHGEQQLLSMVIPIAMLIGFTLMPFLDLDDPIARLFPMVLAVAVMSAGFTGQAIAVVFDRRYGALKRMGASALPKWAIIAGKACAVVVVVLLQTLVLGAIAMVMGWSTTPLGVVMGIVFLIVGPVAFTALGLLLGGTLHSEVVLALGNLLWFGLMGVAAIVAMEPGIREGIHVLLMLFPSVALTQGLIDAFHGSFNVFALVIMLMWSALGGFAASKLFRFTA